MNLESVNDGDVEFYVKTKSEIDCENELTTNKVYLVISSMYMDDEFWYRIKNDHGDYGFYSFKNFRILSKMESRKEKIRKIISRQ